MTAERQSKQAAMDAASRTTGNPRPVTPTTVVNDNQHHPSKQKRKSQRESTKVAPDPAATGEEPATVEESEHAATESSESKKKNGSTTCSSPDRFSPSSSSASYPGVTLKDTVGTLTVTADRLLFKPQNKADKDHIFAWPLDLLQKHQISANNNDQCLLKLISQQNPTKAVTMTFPHRHSLESIHQTLSRQLQPLRKYRKVKETLLSTQRKLKEANKSIDELQDANEKLLIACEKFAKKSKALTQELTQKQLQENAKRVSSTKVQELENRLATLQNQNEKLQNEKTAMHIEFEMDMDDWKDRVRNLENDLALERSATERLLEDRQPWEELQLEVSVLAKQLLAERQAHQQLQDRVAKQERQAEESLWQVRRQRNNALLELAQVKKERDGLLLTMQETIQQNSEESPLDEHNGTDGEERQEEALPDNTPLTRLRQSTTLLSPSLEVVCPYSSHHHGILALVSRWLNSNGAILAAPLPQIPLWEVDDVLIQLEILNMTNGPVKWGGRQAPLWRYPEADVSEAVIEEELKSHHCLPDNTPVGAADQNNSPLSNWWWDWRFPVTAHQSYQPQECHMELDAISFATSTRKSGFRYPHAAEDLVALWKPPARTG
ncbi:expressed unknown protein [Seminavis robusta]|uniref:TFIIH p62 subunit N-terminal domain-containing protein n=1 Tax=Seminavis robusta TaxID=568900 RepID=A0A9N8HYY5_9STRA|nr:expressed unknown protein [Seminavis robusta]|eukprot:Sro3119_g344150.1 n/a (608) ;mRNA; f:4508-6331